MNKTLIAALVTAAVGSSAVNAQVIKNPSFGDNWSIGLDGGVTTPMKNNAFFGSMRGIAGLHLQKQVTPVFGLGGEAAFGVNTSSWNGFYHSSTAFDNSYIGVYGTADLFNLFGGYQCAQRPFTIETLLGAGWGHYFFADSDGRADWNFFGAKVGLNFNYNVNEHLTLSLKPSIIWNVTGNYGNKSLGLDINRATFNLMAGVTYNFGPGFQCVRPYDQAEVDALNDQVNDLRGALEASTVATAAAQATADDLALQLQACQNKKPEVVKEVSNVYNSVRFVFFRVGSSAITADQQPNIEMIADYMKSHPKAKVVIKGYASPEGNYDFNMKLAKNRAESVKNSLVKKYKIAADRITAEGEGIGKMFDEPSWNRVSICTLEQD